MITLLSQGTYTLIETKGQTKILTLDDKTTFAWVWVEDIGEILVSSHRSHQTDHLLAAGQYRLYDVKDEPNLTDLQHLELAVGAGGWQGYLLPTGLPNGGNTRNRIIPAKELIFSAVFSIEQLTRQNSSFRSVAQTSQHCQVVVMSLMPGEDIGSEAHTVTDQFIRIESGAGRLVLNGREQPVGDGDAFVIPAGAQHNVINTSTDQSLKLYTIYSPPHHRDGTVHQTKKDAAEDRTDQL